MKALNYIVFFKGPDECEVVGERDVSGDLD